MPAAEPSYAELVGEIRGLSQAVADATDLMREMRADTRRLADAVSDATVRITRVEAQVAAVERHQSSRAEDARYSWSPLATMAIGGVTIAINVVIALWAGIWQRGHHVP